MRNKRNESRLSIFLVVLLALLTVALPAGAQLQLLTEPAQSATTVTGAAAGSSLVSTPQPVGAEFTIRSVVEVAGSGMYADGATTWLAGIGRQKGAVPTALALTWEPKESWLGFTWSLQLRSDAGLVPVSLVRAGGTGTTTVDLIQADPQPGHKYEALLSYSAKSGALSLRFTDLTDGKVHFQGAYVTSTSTAVLYAAAGQVKTAQPGEDKHKVIVERVQTYNKYLPVGLDWAAGLQASGDDFLPVLRFERDDNVSLQIRNFSHDLPGQLQIQSVTESASKIVARLQATSGDRMPMLSAANLPIGASVIGLEYSEDGIALLQDTRDLIVGVVKADFTNVVVDKEKKQLNGSVQFSSRGPIDNIDLSIKAVLAELVWDTQKRSYEKKPVAQYTLVDKNVDIPGKTPDNIPFTLNMPAQPGYWQLTFEPAVAQSVGIVSTNLEQRFSTYAPAVLTPGESYTIALLPDTQYYTQSYPTIYLRQLQWLAEQAADKNIVLTLGLGDITDDNIPGQWDVAAKSFAQLDGVMPFVLSQGNHDLRSPSGEAKDRNDSLINKYFPISSQPWIAGTYEKDRIENSYSLFNFQGTDYLVLSLEFGPRDGVLAWANKVVAQYPNHKVIMITHNYTGSSGARSGSATGYPLPDTNAGPDMWYSLVSKNANFHLVFSGHIHSDAIPINIGLGQNRNWVFEMLMDYQSDPSGGNGYLCLATFHPDGKIEIRSYSPYLGQDRTIRDKYGYTNHYFLDPVTGKYVKQ